MTWACSKVRQRSKLEFLTHIMLTRDIGGFENSVDPDQLASEKLAD